MSIPEDSIYFGEAFGFLYRPKIYVFTSLMVSFINLLFYSGLLYLLEVGYIKRFFN